jgi:dienelactone hydrolase
MRHQYVVIAPPHDAVHRRAAIFCRGVRRASHFWLRLGSWRRSGRGCARSRLRLVPSFQPLVAPVIARASVAGTIGTVVSRQALERCGRLLAPLWLENNGIGPVRSNNILQRQTRTVSARSWRCCTRIGGDRPTSGWKLGTLFLCCGLLVHATQVYSQPSSILEQAVRVARPHIKTPDAACAASGALAGDVVGNGSGNVSGDVRSGVVGSTSGDIPGGVVGNTPGDVPSGVVTLRTILAGVPAILRVPKVITKPPIVLWHGFGPPASESELMKALPLDEVAAVKVYLGLPLFGTRAPTGSSETLAQRQASDYASLIFEPVVMGAAKELPSVLAALRNRQCLGADQKIGLFGFSAGGAAVLFSLAERNVPIKAAITLNAPTGLNEAIEAVEHATKHLYAWTPATRQLAQRTDSIGRASEIAAGNPPPALLIFHGAADEVISPKATLSLRDALLPIYEKSGNGERLRVVIAPDVSHDWTEPQALQQVRTVVANWFNQHL